MGKSLTFPVRPKIVVTHNKRIEFILQWVENSDSFTLEKTPKGYRAYTDHSSTRICDNALEALDEAIKDDSFF